MKNRPDFIASRTAGCDRYILFDRSREQVGFLQYDPDPGTQVGIADLRQIHVPDRDAALPLAQGIQLLQEVHERRFTGACASQYADR